MRGSLVMSASTLLAQEGAMFGSKKSGKGGKEDRHRERKENEARWGFLGSAKDESDRRASRGEGWHEPRD